MSEDFGPNFITLTDEDGNEFELEYIDALEVDGQTYMAFFPAVEDEADEESEDYGLVILKSVTETARSCSARWMTKRSWRRSTSCSWNSCWPTRKKIPDRFCENPFYFSRRSVIIRPSPKGEVPQGCDGSFLSSHFVIGDVGSVCGSQASRLPSAAGSWKR